MLRIDHVSAIPLQQLMHSISFCAGLDLKEGFASDITEVIAASEHNIMTGRESLNLRAESLEVTGKSQVYEDHRDHSGSRHLLCSLSSCQARPQTAHSRQKVSSSFPTAQNFKQHTAGSALPLSQSRPLQEAAMSGFMRETERQVHEAQLVYKTLRLNSCSVQVFRTDSQIRF